MLSRPCLAQAYRYLVDTQLFTLSWPRDIERRAHLGTVRDHEKQLSTTVLFASGVGARLGVVESCVKWSTYNVSPMPDDGPN